MAIKQRTKSLSVSQDRLSDTFYQLEVLTTLPKQSEEIQSFENKIRQYDQFPLKPTTLEIFQLNIGKLCNQTCVHCHVDAGPDKKRENMDKATLVKCLQIIREVPTIHTVDITGGAPELNPHFKWFVEECRKLNKKVIDRCNLTIILANKKYHDLPIFFKKNKVHIVSSLPHFSKLRTDKQRGSGVFEDSITALKMLNEVGYGRPDSGLVLDLVYNPSGAFLPGSQQSLEAEFKHQLFKRYAIEFNSLFCITNLPVSRFLKFLLDSGNYESYMQKLIEAFNPATLQGLMCKNTMSVSWDGYLYDCDFNQMLDLKVACSSGHIDNFNLEEWNQRYIITNQHCYGCTAGAGSSCGGEIVES